MIEKALFDAFGFNFKEESIKPMKGLPVYLSSGRNFSVVKTKDIFFIIVSMQIEERFGALSLQKQLQQYMAKSNMNVAFAFDTINKRQRDALVARGIPFIALPDQIFLPFLGISLSNKFKNTSALSSKKMMPATQSLFLYLLYYPNEYGLNKKTAAEKLGLTKTSITRASSQLLSMNLITEEKIGKEAFMLPVNKGLDLYEMATPFLINPVSKRMYIRDDTILKSAVVSGESALSDVTMLNLPNVRTFAIYKELTKECTLINVDPQWDDYDYVQLELWKYDPRLFAKENIADPISLALSFESAEDERIAASIEEYLEEYKW